MKTPLLFSAFSALSLANMAAADAPSVAVDIAPIHSLIAAVMDGVGSPNLIVQSGASPHGYSLRPSEADALQSADIVFWVSDGLTPWIEGSIAALAKEAKLVELAEIEGTTELPFREGATFEAHKHDEEEHDEHDEDGHDEHGDDEQDEHHGHDPHAWLDPENARLWLDVIAAELSTLDPENATTYAANAAAKKAELAALISEINADLVPFRDTNFVVFHDAYQYFENRFGIAATGAISLGDASDPSPARIAEIRDKVVELNVTCAFSEPQFNAGLIQTVFQGLPTVTGVMDPHGSELELGPDLYPQLLRDLSDTLNACIQ